MLFSYSIHKVIPIEQGLKQPLAQSKVRASTPHKDHSPQQGLKQDDIKICLGRGLHLQRYPIEQGLKLHKHRIQNGRHPCSTEVFQ